MSMTALADTILILHALVVLFIVGGFAVIWAGAALGWRWVREPRLRFAHLGAIGIVALLALLDIPCPLTVLESWLRRDSGRHQGFIEYWLERLIYYDFPPWVFTLSYALFAVLVLCTWRFVAPRKRR
jgi:Protein of Unknown function (DUF2784)